MTSQDFALFLAALLNGSPDQRVKQRVAGPSLDPADRPPVSD